LIKKKKKKFDEKVIPLFDRIDAFNDLEETANKLNV